MSNAILKIKILWTCNYLAASKMSPRVYEFIKYERWTWLYHICKCLTPIPTFIDVSVVVAKICSNSKVQCYNFLKFFKGLNYLMLRFLKTLFSTFRPLAHSFLKINSNGLLPFFLKTT